MTDREHFTITLQTGTGDGLPARARTITAAISGTERVT